MSEMMRDQTPAEDMLVDRGVDDLLDEGYSPPERMPATHSETAAEMHEGETLDDRLVQEEPEPDAYEVAASEDPTATWAAGSDADPRAGRLVAPDEGAHTDAEKDEVAFDAGIDGGAASAEEAAMHVVSEDVAVLSPVEDATPDELLDEAP